jgi:hypothetical protein
MALVRFATARPSSYSELFSLVPRASSKSEIALAMESTDPSSTLLSSSSFEGIEPGGQHG